MLQRLFWKTNCAYQKAVEWIRRNKEFIKIAGFVLMAELVIHDKKAKDTEFMKFLPIIKREGTDNRNFVKKAVNWALCQIGKRSTILNEAAIQTAQKIQDMDSKIAKSIASDTLRELTSQAIQRRLRATIHKPISKQTHKSR